MKRLTPIVLVVLTAFALSGCGGEYTPANVAPSESNGGGTGTVGPAQVDDQSDVLTPSVKGPGMTTEFNAEVEKAKDAWREFKADRTAEKYIVAMVHMYNTMRYKNIHEKNGHSSSSLRGYQEFRRLYWADKSKIAPPAGVDDDPRLKEAKKLFDESQSAS